MKVLNKGREFSTFGKRGAVCCSLIPRPPQAGIRLRRRKAYARSSSPALRCGLWTMVCGLLKKIPRPPEAGIRLRRRKAHARGSSLVTRQKKSPARLRRASASGGGRRVRPCLIAHPKRIPRPSATPFKRGKAYARASALIPYALCLIPYALSLMPYTLCLMPYPLCLIPYALSLMPYPLCLLSLIARHSSLLTCIQF
jgi:hypothetical protein